MALAAGHAGAGQMLLPDRFPILARRGGGRLLAFALDRARGRPSGPHPAHGSRAGLGPAGSSPPRSWSWPSSRWSFPATCRRRQPGSGRLEQAFARLRLPPSPSVLVIPDLARRHGAGRRTPARPARWSAAAAIAPDPAGKATSYSYERLPDRESTCGALGRGRQPAEMRPARARVPPDLAYWQRPRSSPPPPQHAGSRVPGRRLGHGAVEVRRLFSRGGGRRRGELIRYGYSSFAKTFAKKDMCLRRSSSPGGPVPRLAPVRAAAGRRLRGDLPGQLLHRHPGQRRAPDSSTPRSG